MKNNTGSESGDKAVIGKSNRVLGRLLVPDITSQKLYCISPECNGNNQDIYNQDNDKRYDGRLYKSLSVPVRRVWRQGVAMIVGLGN